MHICPVLLSPCPFCRLGRNVPWGIEDMNSLPVLGCEGIWNNVQRYFRQLTFPGNQIKKEPDHVMTTIGTGVTTVTALTAAVAMATSETRLEQQYERVSGV